MVLLVILELRRPYLKFHKDGDAYFNEERKTNNSYLDLTFSGFLNILDGLASVEGVIIRLTTNHIERLDPTLLRAGRVDRRFKFSTPTRKELEALFRYFYPNANTELSKQFAEKVIRRQEK